MDTPHYLPEINTQRKGYSPSGVKKLFRDAVKIKNGDIELVLKDKRNNKGLIELWYASLLALAVYKDTGKKFLIISGDGPDIHFLSQENVNSPQQDGFPIEIMELFSFEDPVFDGNYDKLAGNVWNKKGKKLYYKCHLLLIMRFVSGDFNISKFSRCIGIYTWSYEKIWLGVYGRPESRSGQDRYWSFFGLPLKETKDIRVDFDLTKDSRYFY